MKKSIRNKIDKILNKDNIKLSYDEHLQKIFINGVKYLNNNIKMLHWFSLIKGTLKINDDNEVLKLIIEIANENCFNSQIEKQKEKELERQRKEQQKELEKLEKEKLERKLNEFIDNFDYSILNDIPKSQVINSIKLILANNGYPIKPAVYNKIFTIYMLKKATAEREKYQSLGYILNSDDKIDESCPTNYGIFFDNFFYKKDEWETLDKSKSYDKKYCFYDEWTDKYTIIENGDNIELSPERIRTLVRDYAPIKNVYVVNDMYKDWIRNNRKDNALINYLNELIWDKKDRWGIDNDSNNINDNENYICKALNIEQTELNKKMITYSFIHACRQIFWPLRYNYQHILSLLGDTNCGKTKTVRDMFQFPCGIYYCENLDINTDAEWTIGQKLSNCICVAWNEKKGINKAANENIKNFMDLINGEMRYQKKHEQALTLYKSHNICIITFNPGQSKFLSDYSVTYEKRYLIVECNQTEQGFKDNYLHFIEKEREQMWAQLVYWCKNNLDAVNEFNEKDISLIKEIQVKHKSIDYSDIEDLLHSWLNIQTYLSENIINPDIIKNSRDLRTSDKEKFPIKYSAKFISNACFDALLAQNNMDSRHKSLINNYKIMEKLGWKKGSKTLSGHTYRGWNRISEADLAF